MTPHGRSYLGAAIGSPEYISSYVETKVREWAENLHCLPEIAVTQPHAAFAHGLMSKWTYICCPILDIGHKLKALEEYILLVLPERLGGLGLHIPSRNAAHEYHASQQVTLTLCDHIISQDPDYSYGVLAKQLETKAQISREGRERSSSDFNDIYNKLPVPALDRGTHGTSQLQRIVQGRRKAI